MLWMGGASGNCSFDSYWRLEKRESLETLNKVRESKREGDKLGEKKGQNTNQLT